MSGNDEITEPPTELDRTRSGDNVAADADEASDNATIEGEADDDVPETTAEGTVTTEHRVSNAEAEESVAGADVVAPEAEAVSVEPMAAEVGAATAAEAKAVEASSGDVDVAAAGRNGQEAEGAVPGHSEDEDATETPEATEAPADGNDNANVDGKPTSEAAEAVQDPAKENADRTAHATAAAGAATVEAQDAPAAEEDMNFPDVPSGAGADMPPPAEVDADGQADRTDGEHAGNAGTPPPPPQSRAQGTDEAVIKEKLSEQPPAESAVLYKSATAPRGHEASAVASNSAAAGVFDDSTCASRPVTSSMNVAIVRDSVPTEEELELAQSVVQANGSHVLTAFRRGYDNSHDNRMQEGSYSRFLQSTRTVTQPQRLVDTFYGTAPTIGTVPRNVASARARSPAAGGGGAGRSACAKGASVKSATSGLNSTYINSYQHEMTSLAGTVQRPRTHQGHESTFTHSNDGNNTTIRSTGGMRSTAHSTASGRAMGYTQYGRAADGGSGTAHRTATGGTMLRREVELLDSDAYNTLAAQRDRRRNDFRHGKPQPPQRDYVYYNHVSKGYYIPHENPTDALRLQYNDLYDYGPDGTRMIARGADVRSAQPLQQSQPTCRRNPHAQPAMTFGQTQTVYLPDNALARTTANGRRVGRGTVNAARGATSANISAPAAVPLPPSSLRTAKAVDVSRLHCSQFRHTRTIEEVIAHNPAAMRHCQGGITSALCAGKVRVGDVAAPLRGPTIATNGINVAAADSESTDTSVSRVGVGDAGKPRSPLPEMAITSSKAGDLATDVCMGSPWNGTSMAVPSAKNVSAGRSYAVSRLAQAARQDPESTPSAYVN